MYDPDVSVLVSSGYTAESLTAAETDQTLGFLCKPYRPEDLAAAVRQALNRAKGRASRQEPAAEPSLA
jgi:DNA-binding NtrC family response regulator